MIHRVYFSSPFHTQAQRLWNERIAAGLEERGYEVLLPQREAEGLVRSQVRRGRRIRRSSGVLISSGVSIWSWP